MPVDSREIQLSNELGFSDFLNAEVADSIEFKSKWRILKDFPISVWSGKVIDVKLKSAAPSIAIQIKG